MTREAEYCDNGELATKCFLCPNLCILKDNEDGKCLSRGRREGKMMLHTYGKIVAGGIDPIEKKPLYHVAPGSPVFSVGSYGCNLSCRFCQNSDISQSEQPARNMSPEQLADYASGIKGNIGVAFTYNEPGIWFEYIKDCAKLLKEKGLFTIMVTNGYLCAEPFAELCSFVDAMNIDLKGFTENFYTKVCGGKLETIKTNIKRAFAAGVKVELTNLVVTGLNDTREEFGAMVDFISDIDPNIPLHISRYFPRYLEKAPATDLSKLEEFTEIAKAKLNYVYLGNVSGNSDSNCPKCGIKWVERNGYNTVNLFSSDLCDCGLKIPFLLPSSDLKVENN
jgi:pyruvate formate lyase activating enzyme